MTYVEVYVADPFKEFNCPLKDKEGYCLKDMPHGTFKCGLTEHDKAIEICLDYKNELSKLKDK